VWFPTMNLKELFTEDRGVSPVIGVILMVAITVILAAVIGAFVLGLGDQASSSAPQAQFGFSYDTDGDTSTVTIDHSGGQDVSTDEIEIRVDGQVMYNRGNYEDDVELDETTYTIDDSPDREWDDTASTGDRQELALTEDSEDFDNLDGEEVSIIWVNPGGDSSNTLATSSWRV